MIWVAAGAMSQIGKYFSSAAAVSKKQSRECVNLDLTALGHSVIWILEENGVRNPAFPKIEA